MLFLTFFNRNPFAGLMAVELLLAIWIAEGAQALRTIIAYY